MSAPQSRSSFRNSFRSSSCVSVQAIVVLLRLRVEVQAISVALGSNALHPVFPGVPALVVVDRRVQLRSCVWATNTESADHCCHLPGIGCAGSRGVLASMWLLLTSRCRTDRGLMPIGWRLSS